MNSVEILKRIQSLHKDTSIPMPERVFYSGPNYSEVAIYYGHKSTYADLIDFWISILTWVKMDSVEFDDITVLKENTYPGKNYDCEKMAPDADELQGIVNQIKGLNQFSDNIKMIACYKMSKEWDDKKYLFDYGDHFFLYNWYTGE